MLRGNAGQAQIHIDFRQRVCGIENALRRMDGNFGAQLGEQFAFQFAAALLSIEDERLLFLEIGCKEALAGCQGLFAYIVLRYTAQMGFGDFDEVAKDLRIANLEIRNAGALAFSLLHFGDPLLPIL